MSQSEDLPTLEQLMGNTSVFLDSLDPHVQPKSLLQHCGTDTAEPQDQRRWGYAVCRTVYTAESDILFPTAVKRIRDYVINSLMQGEADHGIHQYLYDEAIRRLDFPTIEDSTRLNNVPLIETQPAFQDWLAGREGFSPRYSTFLVIDEVSMHDVVALPEDPRVAWQRPLLAHAKTCVKVVKLVREDPDNEGAEEDEMAYMKCAVGDVLDLWYIQQDPTEFYRLFAEPGFEFGDDDLPLYLATQQSIAALSR